MAEQEVPTTAKVVVIGAGIVGNCLVGHLARLGWTDMVLLDKGPLPNPGGSTGHASNFIFPVDHNKEMALLTLDSQRQYEEMGVNTACGGIEVAMPTAMPDDPFASRFGKDAGKTTGSVRVPS
jgi:glycine/D-amino acid oxidase-like deaminating enzyme